MNADPGTEPLFAATGVDCRFGDVHAVRDATCRIHAAQRIAVTGPSGSGKSTLLHLIAGLRRPSSGTVAWPGLGGDPRRKRSLVAVVFQAPSLLDPLNVVENVELPLLLAHTAPRSARTAALVALDTLDLSGFAARMPTELSGGQAQRVAAARALAVRPRMILADEPTGQLDHDTAGHVIGALVAAATVSGAALVVATHDDDVAEQVGPQWMMRDGELRTSSDSGGSS